MFSYYCRQLDFAVGNLVNWWEAGTKLKYLEKAKCIIGTYSGTLYSQK